MRAFEEQCRALQKSGKLTIENQYLAMVMFLSREEMKTLLRNKKT